MKVLFIANSCCTPRISPKRIYTGYDYIVSEVAERLSSCCEIEIYTLNPCPKNSYIGDVTVRSCVNFKRVLWNFRLCETLRYLRIFFRAVPKLKVAIKSILYYLQVKDIDDLIKKNDYDIIHIHGVGFSTYISALAVAYDKKPFLPIRENGSKSSIG